MAKREKTKYQGVTIYATEADTIFYIRYRKPNEKKQIEEKAGKKSQGMTVAKAAGLRAERMNGKAPTNTERREEYLKEEWTIKKLFDAYQKDLPQNRGRKTDESDFRRLAKLHGKTFKEVTTPDILAMKKAMESCIAPKTIKNTLMLLERIKNYGVKSGRIDAPNTKKLVIDKPNVDNKKTEILTDEQLQKLVTVLETEKYTNPGAVYMYVILLTGIRRSAALALHWDDVDEERMTLRLRGETAKKGKTEYIPISHEVLDLLHLLPKTDSPFLFPSDRKPNTCRESFTKVVNALSHKAELPEGFRPLHGLRHNYASRLASSGQVDLYTLQRLLTHESPEMTARYAHLADEAMKRAAAVGASVILNAGKKEHSSDN